MGKAGELEMAYNSKNTRYNVTGGGSNGGPGSDTPLEAEELSAEDYAIIASGFNVLGELFAFLSLVKAKQVTKDSGGQVAVDPVLFVQSRNKKAAKRKSRLPH